MVVYEGGGSGRVITRRRVDSRGFFFTRPEEVLDTEYSFRGWGDTEALAAEAIRASGLCAGEIGRGQRLALSRLYY